MANPWEKYQAQSSGPWAKYGQSSSSPVSTEPQETPSYLGEAASGLGRAAKSLFVDMPKQLWEYNKTLPGGVVQGVVQDLYRGAQRAGEASADAKLRGENWAGQTLAAGENFPVIGGMVKKAEEAGPGYVKFKPQTLGAATEALATFEGPKLAKAGLSKLHEVLPSLPRAGAGIGLVKERIGTTPSGGMDGVGFQKANAEMNTLQSTGQPVPGPMKAFVEGVQSGTAPKIDIDAMLSDLEKPDPMLSPKENAVRAALAEKTRVKLAAEDATSGPPRPDAGVIDPNTFAGLAKFRTIFNTWKYERSLPVEARNALGHAADAMGQELQTLANRAGYGEEWQKYQDEYASGNNAIRAAAKRGPQIGSGIGMAVGGIAPELLPQVSGIGARTTAGLGGAFAGMKVGERAGRLAEPITKVIVNRPGTPVLRPIPPTPEAYTRTLLAAKEGEISPGEADRRITRAGGKVKVKPLPTPP